MSDDSGRTTKVTWASAEEKADFEAYAQARGLTLPALLKMAAFQYRKKNPGDREKRTQIEVGGDIDTFTRAMARIAKTAQAVEPEQK